MSLYSFGKNEASVFLDENKGKYGGWDRDFFDSEAFLAISEAMNDYEQGRGYSELKFVKDRVKRRLKNAIRKEIKTVGAIPVMVRDERNVIASKNEFETILAGLEPRDRKIFYLYFVEDRTMEAIGKILGITRGRVHQILKRRIRTRVLEVFDGKRDKT